MRGFDKRCLPLNSPKKSTESVTYLWVKGKDAGKDHLP